MGLRFFSLKNLPIIFSTLVLLLTIPLLVLAVSERQELRKEAAEPPFPQVDLNGDGVVNNVDLKLYLEKFPPTSSGLKK